MRIILRDAVKGRLGAHRGGRATLGYHAYGGGRSRLKEDGRRSVGDADWRGAADGGRCAGGRSGGPRAGAS